MAYKFETLGNAIIQLFEDGKPVLATDPWLQGRCYFGSWALDHPLSQGQIQNIASSPFIWISHGHPDHLHPESLQLLPKKPGPRILLADHYSSEVREFLAGEGFEVQVLKFKEWTRLTPTLRVLCMQDMNQDAMLIMEAGDTLIINKNDALPFGQEPWLRKLVHSYSKTYMLSLCAMDADMFNFIDEAGKPLLPDPAKAKEAVISNVSQFCTYLGVQNFCCSSSQHVYVRGDSRWANRFRVTYEDMKTYWTSPTRLVEPFVTVDVETASVKANHPTHETDMSQVSDQTGDDDWNQPMSEQDWTALEEFVRKFQILETEVDFIRFTVAGESRTINLRGHQNSNSKKERGVNFLVPRNSLMETVKWGYFDDLLIGNFMKTQLINMKMYPKFAPYIAKFGGNAKVFTSPQLMKFYWRYFRLGPVAFIRWKLQSLWLYGWKDQARKALRSMGLLEFMKGMDRRMRGLPH